MNPLSAQLIASSSGCTPNYVATALICRRVISVRTGSTKMLFRNGEGLQHVTRALCETRGAEAAPRSGTAAQPAGVFALLGSSAPRPCTQHGIGASTSPLSSTHSVRNSMACERLGSSGIAVTARLHKPPGHTSVRSKNSRKTAKSSQLILSPEG